MPLVMDYVSPLVNCLSYGRKVVWKRQTHPVNAQSHARNERGRKQEVKQNTILAAVERRDSPEVNRRLNAVDSLGGGWSHGYCVGSKGRVWEEVVQR
jgi:hypothetical protein